VTCITLVIGSKKKKTGCKTEHPYSIGCIRNQKLPYYIGEEVYVTKHVSKFTELIKVLAKGTWYLTLVQSYYRMYFITHFTQNKYLLKRVCDFRRSHDLSCEHDIKTGFRNLNTVIMPYKGCNQYIFILVCSK